jgi:hypothetical protein
MPGCALAPDKRIMVLLRKKMFMRCPGLLLLAVIACMIIAGCTQGTGTVQGAAVPATPASPAPATVPVVTAETTLPESVETQPPQPVVTIVHYIPMVKDVKDSQLLFSLQVPEEWNPSTYRLENPENYEGFMYQTDLVKNNTFYIHTYENYRNRDQNYRDACKDQDPSPNMSVVTINGITFDRFESSAGGLTNVTYVSRQSSMNDFGYLTVLAYTVSTSDRFAVEDYDRVVQSFRYYPHDKISSMPGTEIPRLLFESEGGSVKSASRSGSSSPAGGSSSRSSCPASRR